MSHAWMSGMACRELAHGQANSREDIYGECRSASEPVHELGHGSYLNLVKMHTTNAV